ncbi:MAG: BlaI/MecI/CopY family transcriptional regulator [Cyclobacteriaceae bacterium]
MTKPSEAELEILQVLWHNQPCAVKTVHERISEQRKVGYTTTLKQLQRMYEKGLVLREDGEGKSHLYRAAISADTIKGNLFDGLVAKVFDNSISDLVLHALGSGKTSKKEMEQIKEFLGKLDKNENATTDGK